MTTVSRRQLFLGAAALSGAQLAPAPAAAGDAHLYGVRAIFSTWRPRAGLAEFICLDAEEEDRQWKQHRYGFVRYAKMPFLISGGTDRNHVYFKERVTLLGGRPLDLYSHDPWFVSVIVNGKGRRLEFPTTLRERSRGEEI